MSGIPQNLYTIRVRHNGCCSTVRLTDDESRTYEQALKSFRTYAKDMHGDIALIGPDGRVAARMAKK